MRPEAGKSYASAPRHLPGAGDERPPLPVVPDSSLTAMQKEGPSELKRRASVRRLYFSELLIEPNCRSWWWSGLRLTCFRWQSDSATIGTMITGGRTLPDAITSHSSIK